MQQTDQKTTCRLISGKQDEKNLLTNLMTNLNATVAGKWYNRGDYIFK